LWELWPPKDFLFFFSEPLARKRLYMSVKII
jgi:hypothetical protein